MTAIRLSPPVIEAWIPKPERAPHTIDAATAGASPDTHVRLHVGRTSPPPGIRLRIRDDLVYQIVAYNAASAEAWQTALAGGEAS
ncbi:hypothetical protein [Agromyces sp. NPDC057865]|uniref:hypothetical protein n=1 Tax=Agromyces sp. NPDC057865 TaxID=3346267 RepID=UPI003672B4D8